MIEQRFPEDGIIGEEFGRERPDADRQWILDPIDGTLSFVQGVPLYGVLVAVEEGREAIVGEAHELVAHRVEQCCALLGVETAAAL